MVCCWGKGSGARRREHGCQQKVGSWRAAGAAQVLSLQQSYHHGGCGGLTAPHALLRTLFAPPQKAAQARASAVSKSLRVKKAAAKAN